MKTITMLNKKILSIIFIVIVLSGCGKLKGTFAYKTIDMDMYRLWNYDMEFDRDDKIDWVFKINEIDKERYVGVVMLKKEVGWIDIDKYTATITPFAPNVYGEFQNLEPGNYKVTLVEQGMLIDEVEFIVYDD